MLIKHILLVIFTHVLPLSIASAQLVIGPNVLVSGKLEHVNEVSIAIDLTSPSTLVAGSNLLWAYRSTDRGASWSTTPLTSSYGVWGDPVVLSDQQGRIYYAHLSGNDPKSLDWLDRMVVQISTDGGQTFNDGAWTGLNPYKDQDKEWLSCDYTHSPYRGNIYMSWTEFDKYGSNLPGDSSRILFARSTDAGESWSEPIVVSDQGGDCLDMSKTVEGATTAVGPNGEVYLSWAGSEGIYFDRSTDGGLSFGKDTVLFDLIPGWYFSVEGVYRCNGFPTTVCDISPSPYRGNLYILFSDWHNGNNNTDVFLLRSKDGGNTWDPIKLVNSPQVYSDQFFPAIAIDQSSGFIYVVYYDRRRAKFWTHTEVFLSRSTDGGDTFTDTVISESPFDAVDTVFLGDYIHIAAHEGHIYPIWTRIDSGKRTSIWMSHIIDSAGLASIELPAPEPEFQIYPNPVHRELTIDFGKVPSHVMIYDALGREVDSRRISISEENIKVSTIDWPPGIYYCVNNMNGIKETRRFIVRH